MTSTRQTGEVVGPDSYSAVGKFFLAVDHLTRTTWRWGESCGIDDVSWDAKGDSYNEGCRDDHQKAKRALVEAFHAAVAEKVAVPASDLEQVIRERDGAVRLLRRIVEIENDNGMGVIGWGEAIDDAEAFLATLMEGEDG